MVKCWAANQEVDYTQLVRFNGDSANLRMELRGTYRSGAATTTRGRPVIDVRPGSQRLLLSEQHAQDCADYFALNLKEDLRSWIAADEAAQVSKCKCEKAGVA
nr:HLA class I histocompatibility antigen, alpha chain G-like [Loxodonta africana]XP_023397446.1 HLA class I histocompatibility antigen, alpha chain G-like [Loxodonta africana]